MEACNTCKKTEGFIVIRSERKRDDWKTGEMLDRTISSYRQCRSCGIIDKYRSTTFESDGGVRTIGAGEDNGC